MVIESDTLGKDEVGAVFAYLNRRLKFNLHAIIDTAGKVCMPGLMRLATGLSKSGSRPFLSCLDVIRRCSRIRNRCGFRVL